MQHTLRSQPRLSTSGWLALALSLAGHGLLWLLCCFLPGQDHTADRPTPVLVDTCVLLEDPETPANRGQESGVRSQGEPVAVPVTLPEVTPQPTPGSAPESSPSSPSTPVGGSSGTGATPGDGSAGTGSGTETATFFQVAAPARRVVYLIDRSASMGFNGGLTAAKRELLASLQRLPSTARFQVVFYNSAAAALPGAAEDGLLPVSAASREQVALFLQTLGAAGGTDHAVALRSALDLGPDVLFWVTDAGDLTLAQVRSVTAWNNDRTAIHAIELTNGGDSGDSPLAVLAHGNRGTYRTVSLDSAE